MWDPSSYLCTAVIDTILTVQIARAAKDGAGQSAGYVIVRPLFSGVIHCTRAMKCSSAEPRRRATANRKVLVVTFLTPLRGPLHLVVAFGMSILSVVDRVIRA
jgi:hypothetical protein